MTIGHATKCKVAKATNVLVKLQGTCATHDATQEVLVTTKRISDQS